MPHVSNALTKYGIWPGDAKPEPLPPLKPTPTPKKAAGKKKTQAKPAKKKPRGKKT